jgi:hypothetical protein
MGVGGHYSSATARARRGITCSAHPVLSCILQSGTLRCVV